MKVILEMELTLRLNFSLFKHHLLLALIWKSGEERKSFQGTSTPVVKKCTISYVTIVKASAINVIVANTTSKVIMNIAI